MKESIRTFESVLFLVNNCLHRHSKGGEKCKGCICQNYPETDSCYLATADDSAKPRDWFVPYPPKEDLLEVLAEEFGVGDSFPLSAANIEKLSVVFDAEHPGYLVNDLWLQRDSDTGEVDLMVEWQDLPVYKTKISSASQILDVCVEMGLINI